MARKIQTKSKVVTIKMTPEQYELVDRCAQRCRVNTSAWMRSILLQAASKRASEGYLRIREPNGVTS